MTQTFKSDFLRVMSERGHVNQCTDLAALDEQATKAVISGYVGYDATAKSLHIGNLATIMMLRRLQQTGHRPIVLMGGGTTKVGDPSDKNEARPMRTHEEINENIDSIKTVFSNFLKFGNGATDAIMVNNADWLDKLEYIPFLRDVGQHFTINRMITFDFVRRRLEKEQPLTFLELNYMIMQAYDFAELNQRNNCILQMGGSDQWGNIVCGTELGRKWKKASLYGLTTPLITTASGVKMGKTVSGALWLKKELLSSYDYWQFWRNTEDADVGRFLKLFTDLPLNEITRLENLKDTEINEAKKILAFEATQLAHGRDAAQSAADTAKATFEGGGGGGDLPVFEISSEAVLVIVIMIALGLAASKGEAKRLIEQGGVKLNDQPVTTLDKTISATDVQSSPNGAARLSVGKKKHALIKLVA